MKLEISTEALMSELASAFIVRDAIDREAEMMVKLGAESKDVRALLAIGYLADGEVRKVKAMLQSRCVAPSPGSTP